MSEKTNIEWATSTGNPWIGCAKVSPGCKNCYAEKQDDMRFSKTMGGGTKEKPIRHWGKGAPRVRTKAFWTDAIKWNKAAEKRRVLELHWVAAGKVHNWQRPRIFPSLCDWLDDEVPIEWLADFLNLIADTPNLDWLLLTKRPELCFDRINAATRCANYKANGRLWNLAGCVPHNVWIGVSVEDQKRADERIPLLLKIPAKVRFLSVEPLLERVDLELAARWCARTETSHDCDTKADHIDWVIVGGESGKGRRDCGPEAICDVARQCVAAGVPCFVKQTSAFKPGQQGDIPVDIWKLKEFPKP